MADTHLRDAQRVARDGVLALPAGDIELALVDIGNVAAVVAGVLHAPDADGRALFMTGPEALTMKAIASILSRGTGQAIRYRSISISIADRRLQ